MSVGSPSIKCCTLTLKLRSLLRLFLQQWPDLRETLKSRGPLWRVWAPGLRTQILGGPEVRQDAVQIRSVPRTAMEDEARVSPDREGPVGPKTSPRRATVGLHGYPIAGCHHAAGASL